MKKTKKSVLGLLILVFMVLIAYMITNKNGGVKITNAQNNGITIRESGNVSQENKDYMTQLWEKLPVQYQSILIEGRWAICITEDSLKDVLGLKTEAAGATKTDKKMIYFPDNESSLDHSFYHEVGHAIDSACGDISSRAEFKSILKNEAISFRRNYKAAYYYTSNEKEYFAEAFEKYIQNAELLKQYCPKTFAFFDQLTNG